MKIPALYEQIRTSFRYLVDEHGFVVAREETLPHYADAQVVFQSADCCFAVVRDMDVIYVNVSSAVSPESWWPLQTVVEYMTKERPTDWYDEFPADADVDTKEKWLIDRLAEVLRPYCTAICELVRQGDLEQHASDLRKILMRLP
jgi:hypothetical protein